MHGSDVLNLVLACVMWIVLKEWDSRMFEDIGSYLDQLKYLLRHETQGCPAGCQDCIRLREIEGWLLKPFRATEIRKPRD